MEAEARADVRADEVAAAVADVAAVLAERGEPLDLAHRLVHHTAHLLSASAVGLLVEDSSGRLELLAASSSEALVVELFQLQDDEGPCLDCYRTGAPTAETTAADMAQRWPRFAAKAREQGIVAVHTVPVQVQGRTIGALNLFRDHEGPFSTVETDVAHAMASFGGIGIGQLIASAEGERLRDQLQEALDSRVVLEQAKGVLAERHRIGPEEAFGQLRMQARGQRRRLRDVAADVVADLDRVRAGQA
ncbi:GAF and ANTAR domain-containing protein [Kineococcus rhizosphaerae]|uniref:GAF domain-containing protein n=1 Tax=Kineococcus rhizosphaerae TaxID=559628 RepID=A0A2T0R356_9ACTN|nr:GAF and ANTAR domain-containing protein [Kineococcus rhizosphaerae]PRY14451.1 GAF domain-containing protein [Kineococcus rhizosphaerae]